MKYFIAIALIAAVASAAIIKPTQVSGELAEIQEIIAAINSPSTNPATAAALEEMLWDVLGLNPEPVSVGPAIVDFPVAPSPVVVVPAPVGPTPVVPSPVVVVPGPAADVDASSAPLIQIVLNINQASSESVPVEAVIGHEPVHVVETAPIAVNPVGVVDVAPTPVQVVEVAPTPVQVVEVAPTPVQVVEVAPTPVQVVEVAPEPVVIGTPILPSPAITLPETLN